MFFVCQGNINFESEDKETCSISNPGELSTIATLLDVSKEDLEKALCYRVVAAKGEVMEKSHTNEQAYYGRDAFAKVSQAGVDYRHKYAGI